MRFATNVLKLVYNKLSIDIDTKVRLWMRNINPACLQNGGVTQRTLTSPKSCTVASMNPASLRLRNLIQFYGKFYSSLS